MFPTFHTFWSHIDPHLMMHLPVKSGCEVKYAHMREGVGERVR